MKQDCVRKYLWVNFTEHSIYIRSVFDSYINLNDMYTNLLFTKEHGYEVTNLWFGDPPPPNNTEC